MIEIGAFIGELTGPSQWSVVMDKKTPQGTRVTKERLMQIEPQFTP